MNNKNHILERRTIMKKDTSAQERTSSLNKALVGTTREAPSILAVNRNPAARSICGRTFSCDSIHKYMK